jgi:hypothetical protein
MSTPAEIATGVTAPARRRRGWSVLSIAALLVAAVWAWNQLTVARPVKQALARDSRNAGYAMNARYAYYLLPSTVVLDVTRLDSAAPVDLWRGLFQSAKALADAKRPIKHVVLARKGTAVFFMEGKDFLEVGRAYDDGENPIYLLRTLPEKLYRPTDGRQAYGTWRGGLLGVTMRQMEDLSDAGRTWAQGLERAP